MENNFTNETEQLRIARNKREWIFSLGFGALCVYLAFMSSESSIIPPIVIYLCALIAFVYALWQATAPYLILTDQRIILKSNLLKIRNFNLRDIEDITLNSSFLRISIRGEDIDIDFKSLTAPEIQHLKEKIVTLIEN